MWGVEPSLVWCAIREGCGSRVEWGTSTRCYGCSAGSAELLSAGTEHADAEGEEVAEAGGWRPEQWRRRRWTRWRKWELRWRWKLGREWQWQGRLGFLGGELGRWHSALETGYERVGSTLPGSMLAFIVKLLALCVDTSISLSKHVLHVVVGTRCVHNYFFVQVRTQCSFIITLGSGSDLLRCVRETRFWLTRSCIVGAVVLSCWYNETGWLGS